MITGIDKKHITKELNIKKLPDYWGQYFLYKKDLELYNITRLAFLKIIDIELKKEKPYIDSKIIISKILTELSEKHNFHRLFNERHSELHREQVLGMQLYDIMVKDKENIWVYHETHHSGHLFPNATYFLSKPD